MKPANFDYLRPDTLEEAVAALSELGDDARVLAGGQSLLPMLSMRLVRPEGRAVRSCLMLAVQAKGRRVDTVESLSADGQLSILQAAFRRHHALQCGFCTPGILMSLDDYLRRHPHPTEGEIRILLSGHLCRCTGYTGIVRAALEAAAALAEKAGA